MADVAGVHAVVTVRIRKDPNKAFLCVLIDLIIELFGFIIKSFDNKC